MKVLVACEFSATVRDAFRRKGHDAWSCDVLPTEGDPAYHIQADVMSILGEGWDMMIAHPPCQYLSKAGVRWLWEQDGRWQKMYDSARFFKGLLNAPIKKVAIENPVMHRYATEKIGCKQNQVLQPWMFGHMEAKGTGLWLRNLPLLLPTNNVRVETMRLTPAERDRVLYVSPSPDRWKIRSRTYSGIAEAMASQWG